MKTNQDMTRYIDGLSVTQRTSDGYFDGSELLRQWNSIEGNSQRKMEEFLESPKTQEFINALVEENSKTHLGEFSPKIDNQVLKKSKIKMKGIPGRPKEQLWMHPILFIKFAMWINPTFEVKVIKFVYDEMIKYRNDAGDAYKILSASISKLVNADFMRAAMKKIAEALNWIVFNSHEKMIRNKGDEDKLRELWSLEKKVADLIDEGFIKSYEQLVLYLRNLYARKHFPPALSV